MSRTTLEVVVLVLKIWAGLVFLAGTWWLLNYSVFGDDSRERSVIVRAIVVAIAAPVLYLIVGFAFYGQILFGL